jgi:ribosomal protein S27E
MFQSGSSQKVWWKCSKCGHNWTTSIYHRAKSNTGCPVCYRKKNKGGNHAEAKKIYQYDQYWNLIKEWDCISEASRTLKINASNISMCAKHARPLAGGFHWEYAKVENRNCEQPDLF